MYTIYTNTHIYQYIFMCICVQADIADSRTVQQQKDGHMHCFGGSEQNNVYSLVGIAA